MEENMKRTLKIAAVLLAALPLIFASCAKKDQKQAGAAYHIGMVTGTVSQSEDDLRGAEELISRYGSVAGGGIIQHITYPDNFMDQQEVTISQIVTLAQGAEKARHIAAQTLGRLRKAAGID
jgi:geranylgeranyl pyrophosphate synthase